ncbi:hypothetical protein P153DRAFT_140067 [Dothidotthia symphoricarpi CBS 119687]|uniref:Uncharacterized protein n=1 Tax=Dothidotthia symphoricarpi CBS 119687 TaxID=1392245 RepID=A0A6A5ZZ74_9PLEO|nr:uncharacterized protein P153DRAFT_140067 [Dothidotthia symphoricarpi CBS 119687]KAF2124325.1 hypothetical protein P153DRAFT_140067 [Dothidotthia symphoricarpi CBS 119687]
MAFNQLKAYYLFQKKHQQDPQDLFDEWEKILKKGQNPNEDWGSRFERRCSSPLFRAVLNNDHNSEGRTPLQEAIIEHHGTVVQLLLDRGAKLDTPILSKFLFGGHC